MTSFHLNHLFKGTISKYKSHSEVLGIEFGGGGRYNSAHNTFFRNFQSVHHFGWKGTFLEGKGSEN